MQETQNNQQLLNLTGLVMLLLISASRSIYAGVFVPLPNDPISSSEYKTPVEPYIDTCVNQLLIAHLKNLNDPNLSFLSKNSEWKIQNRSRLLFLRHFLARNTIDNSNIQQWLPVGTYVPPLSWPAGDHFTIPAPVSDADFIRLLNQDLPMDRKDLCQKYGSNSCYQLSTNSEGDEPENYLVLADHFILQSKIWDQSKYLRYNLEANVRLIHVVAQLLVPTNLVIPKLCDENGICRGLYCELDQRRILHNVTMEGEYFDQDLSRILGDSANKIINVNGQEVKAGLFYNSSTELLNYITNLMSRPDIDYIHNLSLYNITSETHKTKGARIFPLTFSVGHMPGWAPTITEGDGSVKENTLDNRIQTMMLFTLGLQSSKSRVLSYDLIDLSRIPTMRKSETSTKALKN